MQSAAAEVRVGNESVDAGERFEPQKHLERVHLVEKIANGFRDVASLMKISELLFQRIVESHPLHLARRGELAQNGVERFILEQSVEHDVRKRVGRYVGIAKRARIVAKRQRCHVTVG